MKIAYATVIPYVTKDGSAIRELVHPAIHGNRGQSVAEAELAPGQRSARHLHRASEEIYHFLAGTGVMHLGQQEFRVDVGDTVWIPRGTPHDVHNTGTGPLRFLCCCAPAYAHEDTELLQAQPAG